MSRAGKSLPSRAHFLVWEIDSLQHVNCIVFCELFSAMAETARSAREWWQCSGKEKGPHLGKCYWGRVGTSEKCGSWGRVFKVEQCARAKALRQCRV